MAASKDYTAIKAYREAIKGLPINQNNPAYVERFLLIDQATDIVVPLFFDMLAESYITKIPITLDTPTCKYLSTGTASWTAATLTISGATMTGVFDATDVGKLITFRIGTLAYVGVVSSYVSASSVTVQGTTLPTSDSAAVADIIVLKTVPSGGSVNLSTLRIMRAGHQVRLKLESSATTDVFNATSQEIATFRASADENLNKLVWAISGDNLLFAIGTGLANAGTLTLSYPRIPTRMIQDSSPVDVPDGAPMQLMILKLRALIAMRNNIPLPDMTQQLLTLVQQLYMTFGQEARAELVTEKMKALK